MNKKIQLFNAIQMFTLLLYLSFQHKLPCNYIINLYSIPLSEYIILLLLLSIEIYKLASLMIVILLFSIIGTLYYIFCYVNILTKCSINIESNLNIYLIYILLTLFTNNILLLLYYSSYLKNNIPFNPPIINEHTSLLSED